MYLFILIISLIISTSAQEEIDSIIFEIKDSVNVYSDSMNISRNTFDRMIQQKIIHKSIEKLESEYQIENIIKSKISMNLKDILFLETSLDGKIRVEYKEGWTASPPMEDVKMLRWFIYTYKIGYPK